MDQLSPQCATTADLPGIQQLMVNAYTKYIERIGHPPAPMTADYAAALNSSRVWVLRHRGAIVGALVTEDRADHLLLETVASPPAPRAAATAGCCSSAPSAMPSNSG